MRPWIPFLALTLVACGPSTDEEPRGGDLFDAPAPEATSPVPPPPVIPEGAPRVVFVGDSIAAGLHLAEHQAFPARLQDRLAQQGTPFHLVNASESGRTSAGGVTVMDWILRQQPDLVVISVGGNDGLRGISLEDTEANLRTMIMKSQEAGSQVLLLGVRLPENYGEYGAAFDAIYPRLAESLEVPIVPFYMEGVGAVPEMNLEDGLHPTPEGQERLAENIETGLREALANLRPDTDG